MNNLITRERIVAAVVIIILCAGAILAIDSTSNRSYAVEASYENQIGILKQAVEDCAEQIAENAELIYEINNRGYVTAEDFVKETYNADNITIEAGKYSEVTLTSSAVKTGYTAKGVLGFYINNATKNGKNRTHCMVNRVYLTGNTLKMLVRNTSSDYDAVVQLNAAVLFIKNK